MCPVRPWSFYLCMTEGLVRRSSGIFVSRSLSTRAISRTLFPFSSGKCFLVLELFRAQGKSVCAYSIRGVSTSFSFLRAGRSPKCRLPRVGGPTQFLLPLLFKDIAYVFEGLRSLGPFVAAGSVVFLP